MNRQSKLAATAAVTLGAALAGMGAIQDASVHETVSKRYSANGLTAEIMGVCHVREDEVSCWDVEGAPHSKLEQLLKGALENGSQGNHSSFRYGKKNRLIVVRTYSNRAQGYINVETSRKNNAGYSNVELRNLVEDLPGDVQSNISTMPLYFERDQTETFVDFSVRSSSGSPSSIEPKVGSKATLSGATIEIIKANKPDPNAYEPFGYARLGTWSFELKVTLPKDYGIEAQAYAMDAKGELIRFVDRSGKPISEEEARKQMARLNPNMPAGFMQPNANVYVNLGSGDRVGMINTTIDPSKIKEIRITPTTSRRIRITGIPLDPKGG